MNTANQGDGKIYQGGGVYARAGSARLLVVDDFGSLTPLSAEHAMDPVDRHMYAVQTKKAGEPC